MSKPTLERIRIDDIVIPEVRVSAKFDPETAAFLRASISKIGLIHEPVVRRLPGGKYELVVGAHRIKVLKERGEEYVYCKVIDVDTKASIEMNITENLARGTYDPIEISMQLNRYIQEGGTIEELVKLTGHTRDWVEKYLTLIKLPPEFQDAISAGLLRIGHIEQAFRLGDEIEIYDALATTIKQRWSVSVFKVYVENRLRELQAWEEARARGMAPPEPPKPRPELASLGECMACKRKLDRKMLYLPMICEECWKLLTYCTQYLGEPTEAMKQIYDAILFRAKYEEYKRMRQMFEEMEKVEKAKEKVKSEDTGYPPE